MNSSSWFREIHFRSFRPWRTVKDTSKKNVKTEVSLMTGGGGGGGFINFLAYI